MRVSACDRVRWALTLGLACASGQAQPVAISAQVSNGSATSPIALSGPYTNFPFGADAAPLTLETRFDRPLAAVRRADLNGSPVTAIVAPEDPRVVRISIGALPASGHLDVDIIDAVDLAGDIRRVTAVPFLGLPGDLNGDGSSNFFDLISFLRTFDAGSAAADINGDSATDRADISTFIGLVGSGPSGPADRPPVIRAPESIFVPTGGASFPTRFTIRDDRTQESSLSVRVTASDNTLIDVPASLILGSDGTRDLVLAAGAAPSGTTSVNIHVSDGAQESTATLSVRVGTDAPPTARFTAPQFVGTAPLTVAFDATPSSDAEGAIQAYGWTMGDGSTATGAQATHTFTNAGDYTVALTVIDSAGMTSTETRVITVAPSQWTENTPISRAEAIRFLWQAAWGPTEADITFVMQNGFSAWIDQEVATPASTMTAALAQDRGQRYLTLEPGDPPNEFAFRTPAWMLFDDLAYGAPDQLRQRLAWALFQIVPINIAVVDENPTDSRDIYNLYLRHVLADTAQNTTGNYRDFLLEMTYNGMMGDWLTYKWNQKGTRRSRSTRTRTTHARSCSSSASDSSNEISMAHRDSMSSATPPTRTTTPISVSSPEYSQV